MIGGRHFWGERGRLSFNKEFKMKTPNTSNKTPKEAMIYQKSSAYGHAGEYLFAYWISRYFGWPCRLLSVDMGIDAQVEMFADDTKSTGAFISVQVKTTSRQMVENLSVRVSLDNLGYWNSQHEPVVIVLISLNKTNVNDEPEIYWRHLDSESLENYSEKARKNKDSKTNVIFESQKHRLRSRHRNEWSKLWMTELDKEVVKMATSSKHDLMEVIREIDEEIEATGYPEEDFNFPVSWETYPHTLNRLLNDYDDFLRLKTDNKLLVMQYPVVQQYMELCDLHLERLLGYFSNLAYHFRSESSMLKEEMESCFPVNVQIQEIIRDNIYNY